MTIEYYREMLEQEARVEAFRRAISGAVSQQDCVLEVGAGLGTYAFFAADAGADRVIAIESDGVIALAKSLARTNGYSDRVDFLRGWFPDVIPDAPPSLVIFEDYPPRLINREVHRMLSRMESVVANDARLLPCRARIYAAPVCHDSLGWLVNRFRDDADSRYGVDWQAMRSYLLNTPMRRDIPAAAMIAEPEKLWRRRVSNRREQLESYRDRRLAVIDRVGGTRICLLLRSPCRR